MVEKSAGPQGLRDFAPSEGNRSEDWQPYCGRDMSASGKTGVH
jgi:hypothetical protein